MPAHDYHEAQSNYHPDQILHDGCQECSYRADNPVEIFSRMTAHDFAVAWTRAIDWQAGRLHNISVTEAPFLRMLYYISVKFRDIRPETALKLLALR